MSPGAASPSAWSADHIRSKFSGKNSTPNSDLKKANRDLLAASKNLETQENGIRYISEIVEFNQITDWTGEYSLQSVLMGIANDVKSTKTDVKEIKEDVTTLSDNFDRLTTRVTNTEFKLGVTPSNETLPIKSSRVKCNGFMVYDSVTKTSKLVTPDEFHRLQQQQPLQSTAAISGASVTLPLPQSSISTAPMPGADKVAGHEEVKKPPQVYYKGGINYSKMPTPHLDDLIEHLKADEALRTHLKGLGTATPSVKPGGKIPTATEVKDYEEKEKLLLHKLSEKSHQMVNALEQGKGGEGKLTKIFKSQLREIQKEQGYQVNPRTRRVADYVDGDYLSDANLNWYLDTTAKEAFEEDILSWEFDTEDEVELAKQMMIRYHKHKCVVGDFSLGDWRDMDRAYGLEARPAYLPTLVHNHLEDKMGLSQEEVEALGIIEITPLLGSFGARYPHSLIITVKNADIAEKLVQKHAELVRKTTKRERSRLFKKFLYFLPDETKDRVTRLDAR